MIVVNEKFLDTLRGLQFCEIGNHRCQATEACHIRAKGIGGGARLDIPENVVAGCHRCHDLQHRGIIPIEALWNAAAKRLKRSAADLRDTVDRYLRSPKNGPLLPKDEPKRTAGETMSAALNALIPKEPPTGDGRRIGTETSKIPAISSDDQGISKEITRSTAGTTEEHAMSEANGVKYHPVVELFPEMTGEDFEELEKDILKNGIRKPVWYWKKQLIAGRTRHKIAAKHGLECPSKSFDKLSEEEAINMAFAEDAEPRRHLTPTQRALAERGKIELLSKLGTESRKRHLKRGTKSPSPPVGGHGENAGKTSISGKPPPKKKPPKKTRTEERVAAITAKKPPQEILDAMRDDVATARDVEQVIDQPHEVLLAALAKVKVKEVKTMVAAVKKLEEEKKKSEVKLHWDARGRLIFDEYCLPRHLAFRELAAKGEEIEKALHGAKSLEEKAYARKDTGNCGEVTKIKQGLWTWSMNAHGCVCPVCYGTGAYSKLALEHILECVELVKDGDIDKALADLKETPTGEKCPLCGGGEDRWIPGLKVHDVDEELIFHQHCKWRKDIVKRKEPK